MQIAPKFGITEAELLRAQPGDVVLTTTQADGASKRMIGTVLTRPVTKERIDASQYHGNAFIIAGYPVEREPQGPLWPPGSWGFITPAQLPKTDIYTKAPTA